MGKNGTVKKKTNRVEAHLAEPERPVRRGELKPVNIPRPGLIYVRAELISRTPGLLLNPFSRKAKEKLLASMQKGKAKLSPGDKNPEAEYAEREAEVRVPGLKDTYWMDSRAFKKAMSRGAKTVDKLAMTDFRSGVFIENDSVIQNKPVVHVKGKAVMDCEHVVNKGQGADYRTRVLLPEWTATLQFIINTTVLSVEQALTCLVNAGIGTGVGDWRPEKDGVHGCWDLGLCEAEDIQ